MFIDTTDPRGFEPRATAIAVRTMGACYAMRFRPDTRPLIGIGLFHVTPDGAGFRFDGEARALREGELPECLLDWLETRLADRGAIVSYDNWGSVPKRLSAIARPDLYPHVACAAADTNGRWRDLPRWQTWHLRQAVAQAMPCLCPQGKMQDCVPSLLACVMPQPELTERQLIDEAARGWTAWARGFGAFDDDAQPASRALKALAGQQVRTGTSPG
ncbi:hypothetical protein [Sphingomonas morindae]|uniref:Uncharacterized protein n=1 Tax=Sphingomonas morindae TaxID=1541170 RepID=A0ABY4X9M8_9SPHN|nr:hypothetical protein [Sphingomonas morindae]USI73519.1 hypothetical protein LHA26_03290 [Sphingomonas morindae]